MIIRNNGYLIKKPIELLCKDSVIVLHLLSESVENSLILSKFASVFKN